MADRELMIGHLEDFLKNYPERGREIEEPEGGSFWGDQAKLYGDFYGNFFQSMWRKLQGLDEEPGPSSWAGAADDITDRERRLAREGLLGRSIR